MRQLPLLLVCGALAACTTSAPKRASGVGFGDDFGGGVPATVAAAPQPAGASTTTAIRGGTVTSQTVVGADGRTRTTRTVEIGTPPGQTSASGVAPTFVASGSVPTYRIDDPRIKGMGYRPSDRTITAIRRAGDSSATSNDARTVPFSAEGISGGLRLVILNGSPYAVLEPANGLGLKSREVRARAASAAAAMAGCTSDNRALVHSGWLATTWIIDVSC
ncbi:hypothetical protein AAD018_006310 [Aestuariibius insulae]|uniref:hypothetical protein n=1 Tax=Aestuariibius insulae TaxID=2058287 RepID=UPI00345E2764